MVNMMDAFEESVRAGAVTHMKKLQETNPTLQFGLDKFGTVCVNGIYYRSEEYWKLKYLVKSKHPRPAIIEKLEADSIEWHTLNTLKLMTEHAEIIRLKMILAKMVKDKK